MKKFITFILCLAFLVTGCKNRNADKKLTPEIKKEEENNDISPYVLNAIELAKGDAINFVIKISEEYYDIPFEVYLYNTDTETEIIFEEKKGLNSHKPVSNYSTIISKAGNYTVGIISEDDKIPQNEVELNYSVSKEINDSDEVIKPMVCRKAHAEKFQ